MVDRDEKQDGDDAVEEKGVDEVSVEGMTPVRWQIPGVEIVEEKVQWSDH